MLRDEKVILVYSNEDELLDQLLIELMAEFRADGKRVFMLDCKGLNDAHIK